MTWTQAQIHQILQWTEGGHLHATQVQQLQALAPLRPNRAAWLAAGERLGLFGGAVLLTAALIFFFAYNWAELHRFAKMGLAAAVLLGCVAGALAATAGALVWQAALFGAALCTGALLALVGQIYQTGADIWELFAAWTALMLPFVLLARAWPHWLLCLLVSNLWLGRWLFTGLADAVLVIAGFSSAQQGVLELVLLLGFNGLWWLLALRCGRWMCAASPSRHLERIAGTLALGCASCGAVAGVFVDAFAGYLPLFMFIAVGMFWCCRHVRLDIVMLGVLGSSTLLVASSALARIVFEGGRGGDAVVFGMLSMAGFVLVATGYLVTWLKGLHRQQHQQALAEHQA